LKFYYFSCFLYLMLNNDSFFTLVANTSAFFFGVSYLLLYLLGRQKKIMEMLYSHYIKNMNINIPPIYIRFNDLTILFVAFKKIPHKQTNSEFYSFERVNTLYIYIRLLSALSILSLLSMFTSILTLIFYYIHKTL